MVPLPLYAIDVLYNQVLVELLGQVLRCLPLVVPGTQHVHRVHACTDKVLQTWQVTLAGCQVGCNVQRNSSDDNKACQMSIKLDRGQQSIRFIPVLTRYFMHGWWPSQTARCAVIYNVTRQATTKPVR